MVYENPGTSVSVRYSTIIQIITLSGPNQWETDNFVNFLHINLKCGPERDKRTTGNSIQIKS